MEYIIYYNHPETGYGFHVKSFGFQDKYMRNLEDICCRVAEPKSAAGNVISMRYTPLQDRYLMSVIFRQPDGDGLQTRGVNTLVNILMTEEETDMHFSQPSADALQEFENIAINLLAKHGVRVTVPAQQPIISQKHHIPDVQLLNAATYASAPYVEKQAFFAVETLQLQEVAAMLERLPRKLRYRTSFLTGIQSTGESFNIAANFGTHQMMDDIAQGGFSGGQSNSKKYLYYFSADGVCQSVTADKEGLNNSKQLLRVLKETPFWELTKPLLIDKVENWAQLTSLVSLDTQDPMPAIMELIPEKSLLEYLNRACISEETLHQMEAVAKKQKLNEIRRAIRQARQRLFPAMPAMEEPIYNPQNPTIMDTVKVPQVKRILSERGLSLVKTVLLFAVKLTITAVMLAGIVWLVKDLLYVKTIEEETVTQVVIGLTEAKQMLMIAGLTGLAMVLSSWITYHITKWCSEKNKKE